MQRLLIIIYLGLATTLFSQITPGEYKSRRQAVLEQLAPNEAMVLFTEAYVLRNPDIEHSYRPNSNFWYLTGFGEHSAVLVLSGRPRTVELDTTQYSGSEFLFMNERNPRAENWGAVRLGPERAYEVLQIDNALPIGTFTQVFNDLFRGIDSVYTNDPSLDKRRPGRPYRPAILRADTLLQWLAGSIPARKGLFKRKAKPRADIRPVRHILAPLRQIKSAGELALLQQAIDLTGTGIIEAAKRAAGGLYEYQLQATLEAAFTEGGSRRLGFPSIMGSGPNALIPHYNHYDRQSKAGELFLMDVGAEVGMYTADVTRTIPLDGKFTTAQADVYAIVLGAQEAAISAVHPGITIKELNAIAKEYIVEAGYEKYIMHGISHFLGLDVHDVGLFREPLKAGSVITVEPGLYIPVDDTDIDAVYQGIGIRIEDDVLVTETGHAVLSQNIPRTIDAIEAQMAK